MLTTRHRNRAEVISVKILTTAVFLGMLAGPVCLQAQTGQTKEQQKTGKHTDVKKKVEKNAKSGDDKGGKVQNGVDGKGNKAPK